MKNITFASISELGMLRLRYFFSFVVITSLHLATYAQQSEIVAGSIEYVWEKDRSAAISGAQPRVVLLSDTSFQSQFKQKVMKAMQDKWPGAATNFWIEYRQLPGLSNSPKLKPKLKNKEPNKKYIFLQVFEKAIYTNVSDGSVASDFFHVNYKFIDGKNDSTLSSKTLDVRLVRRPLAAGQLQLHKLAAYPADLLNALDTIVNWCFSDNAVTREDLLVNPAVAYDTSAQSFPTKKIDFYSTRDIIQVRGDQPFEIRKMEVIAKQTGKKKNVGGNTLGGALTLLTGVRTEKKKYYNYFNDHAFSDGSQLFHCLVGYTQYQVVERVRVKNEDGSHSMEQGDQYAGRFIDQKAENTVILNGDTLCTFKMHSDNRTYSYSKMWNGFDSSTVVSLPLTWNNSAVKQWDMNGTLLGKSFTLESLNDGTVKRLSISGQPVAELYSTALPAYAVLYMSMDQKQLKLLTILSLISTSYHTYN